MTPPTFKLHAAHAATRRQATKATSHKATHHGHDNDQVGGAGGCAGYPQSHKGCWTFFWPYVETHTFDRS
jgi:hypothetical protein